MGRKSSLKSRLNSLDWKRKQFRRKARDSKGQTRLGQFTGKFKWRKAKWESRVRIHKIKKDREKYGFSSGYEDANNDKGWL